MDNAKAEHLTHTHISNKKNINKYGFAILFIKLKRKCFVWQLHTKKISFVTIYPTAKCHLKMICKIPEPVAKAKERKKIYD